MNLSRNGVYVHCVNGSIVIDNHSLQAGDALGVYETDLFNLKALENSELILLEVPMHRGIKI